MDNSELDTAASPPATTPPTAPVPVVTGPATSDGSATAATESGDNGDNGDNGWYIIHQSTLAITGRLHKREAEEINADKTADIREYIARINSAPRCRYSHLYMVAG